MDIAKAAVKSSTTLIGEDTDLLVLLLFYYDLDAQELYYRSGKSVKSNDIIIHDIRFCNSLLGTEFSSKFLFLHAFSGCDSTSSIYGISKATLFKIVIENKSLQDVATIFCSDNLSKDQVITAGETVMVIIFNGTPDQT